MEMTLAVRPTVERSPRHEAARALDPVFWLAVVAAMLLGFGIEGSLAALVVVAAGAVHPGVLVVDALRPTDRLERLVAVASLSVVTWMVLAHVQLSAAWWHPGGIGAAVFAACAVVRLGGSGPPRSRTRWTVPAPVVGVQAGVAAATLVVWWWSVQRLDVSDIGLIGLVGVLPIGWFVALAIAIVSAAVAATAPRTSVARIVVAVVPLLVIIYGTTAVTTATIRYPWAYKHVGVVRLLDETGRLHESVDIYNNFSGFFGVFAAIRGATGVDPASFAAWAQVIGEGLVVLAVAYLVSRVTTSARVTYLTVVVYVLTNWVGQNYFAAQTLASLLALVGIGMIWSWFRVDRQEAAAADPGDGAASIVAGARRSDAERGLAGRRRVAVAAVFLGLLMTHPLTPVVVVGAVVVAVALGRVRDRWLLFALLAVGIAWGARTFGYFAAQDFDLGFGGTPTENAGGNVDVSAPPSQSQLVTSVTRAFSLAVWLLAVVGGVVASWARRRVGPLVVLALIPFGIPLVQSYGGEAIYRVYLYSLPLVAALIAWGVVSTTPVTKRERLPQPTVLASVLCLCLAAGFVVVHYGRERINQVDASEVSIEEVIEAELAGPAIMAQFAGSHPAQSTARYPEFQVNDTYTPHIVEMLGPRRTLPSPSALDDVADDLLALTTGTPYVIVSPGMIDELASLGTFPVADSDEATAFLVSNPRFEVVRQIDDSYLIEVSP